MILGSAVAMARQGATLHVLAAVVVHSRHGHAVKDQRREYYNYPSEFILYAKPRTANLLSTFGRYPLHCLQVKFESKSKLCTSL